MTIEPELLAKLEAILIVADEPVSLLSLATATAAPVARVQQAVFSLQKEYSGDSLSGRVHGFELRELAGGWRIYVREQFDELVSDFVTEQHPTRLSQAALETLAVIAYKQPITRGQVSAIRAVNVDSVVRTLLGRGLITESFSDPETGAIHYITTDLMLAQLGINSIDEMPPIAPLLPDNLDTVQQ